MEEGTYEHRRISRNISWECERPFYKVGKKALKPLFGLTFFVALNGNKGTELRNIISSVGGNVKDKMCSLIDYVICKEYSDNDEWVKLALKYHVPILDQSCITDAKKLQMYLDLTEYFVYGSNDAEILLMFKYTNDPVKFIKEYDSKNDEKDSKANDKDSKTNDKDSKTNDKDSKNKEDEKNVEMNYKVLQKMKWHYNTEVVNYGAAKNTLNIGEQFVKISVVSSINIVSYLEIDDVLELMRVSKYWYMLGQNEVVWNNLCDATANSLRFLVKPSVNKVNSRHYSWKGFFRNYINPIRIDYLRLKLWVEKYIPKSSLNCSEITTTMRWSKIPENNDLYSKMRNRNFGWSKIGGVPDLPNGKMFPGEFKNFYGQVYLDELVFNGSVGFNFFEFFGKLPNLPKTGMLYFFWDWEDEDEEKQNVVFHYDGDMNILKPYHAWKDIDEGYEEPRRMQFHETIELGSPWDEPQYKAFDINTLKEKYGKEIDSFIDFKCEYGGLGWQLMFGTYPKNIFAQIESSESNQNCEILFKSSMDEGYHHYKLAVENTKSLADVYGSYVLQEY